MHLLPGKNIYFLSDFHLGAPDLKASRIREQRLVSFFDEIGGDAQAIFLVGDVFDFWYEYRHVVPKGYVRLLGKLAALHDAGIELHFTAGNHDMWINNYFQDELGMKVHMDEYEFDCNGKNFYVAHGDGLGPGDEKYKFLKRVFRNPVSKFLFGMLPPVIGMGLANYFSRKSRESVDLHEQQFLGEEKEWLIVHSKNVLKHKHVDYFIYGHRHLALTHQLKPESVYVNLGDWVTHFTYAMFNGQHLELRSWKD